MSRQLSIAATAMLMVGIGATAHTPQVLADDESRYRITVTNVTRTQIISPVVVASHSRRMSPLFTLGAPASKELAYVAEDAILDPLLDTLSHDFEVHEVKTLTGAEGPIMPGESASLVLAAPNGFRHVSMVGMLVTTNDAFFALTGERAPRHRRSHHHSPAYDAGSEANNESCAYIPGPPCGNAEARAIDGAEGFVHIHAGVHGVEDGDLTPSKHDWRNPVAKITIHRIFDDD